jgi:hypothetical protein
VDGFSNYPRVLDFMVKLQSRGSSDQEITKHPGRDLLAGVQAGGEVIESAAIFWMFSVPAAPTPPGMVRGIFAITATCLDTIISHIC